MRGGAAVCVIVRTWRAWRAPSRTSSEAARSESRAASTLARLCLAVLATPHVTRSRGPRRPPRPRPSVPRCPRPRPRPRRRRRRRRPQLSSSIVFAALRPSHRNRPRCSTPPHRRVCTSPAPRRCHARTTTDPSPFLLLPLPLSLLCFISLVAALHLLSRLEYTSLCPRFSFFFSPSSPDTLVPVSLSPV